MTRPSKQRSKNPTAGEDALVSQALVALPTRPATNSQAKTWKSEKKVEEDQFRRAQSLFYHFCPQSPFVPKSLKDWAAQKFMILSMKQVRVKKRIALSKACMSPDSKVVVRSLFTEQASRFEDNRSAVLGQFSIWIVGHVQQPIRESAPWPELDELRHEGDDRASSAYGRFLPLPRVTGNETTSWWTRARMLPLSELDNNHDALDYQNRPRRVSIGEDEIFDDLAQIDQEDFFTGPLRFWLGEDFFVEVNAST